MKNPDQGDFVQVAYTQTNGNNGLIEGKVVNQTGSGWRISNLDETFVVKENGEILQGVGHMPFKIGDEAEFTLVEE